MPRNLLIITQKVDRDDQLLGFFIPWLRKFADHFEKVTVLCLEQGSFNLPNLVQVISLGKYHGLLKFKQAWNFYSLTFGLRHNYDTVFVHMNPIGVVVGAWWWHLLGKRVFLWYTSKGVTLKLRVATWFADGIFTASPESFRLKSSKVIVTGHGIDTDLFRPNPSKRLTGLHLLSVGRIAPVKNYEILIQAAHILRESGRDFLVTIIGEPALAQDVEYEKKLKKMIDALGLTSNFKFMGKINNENLVPYYQSHSIFVHLSKTGSLDKVILEAMACGMTVVSCNDASKTFLPLTAVFLENDADSLVVAIRNVMNGSVSPVLRQYVVDHHNLDKLIDTISSIL